MSKTNTKTGQLHFLFIRHGETQDNIDRVLQGWHDTSLTDKGHHEAQVLAEKLHDEHIDIDIIYHSPLTRMLQTIAPLRKAQPNIPVHADPDLRGQTLGELEGKSYDTIDMSNPRSADGGPGVELFNDFVARLKVAFGRIVGVEAPKVGDVDRTVAIATHGVAITSLFKCLENTPICDGFNPRLAWRGSEAFEVRWTDSDDVARIVVEKPKELPIQKGELEWERLHGEPFEIRYWGKKEKSIEQGYTKEQ